MIKDNQVSDSITDVFCASYSWVSAICCDAIECKNTNLLHTTILCRRLFIIVVMMMMMEIMMNPMSVPNITAHLDLNEDRFEFSSKNRAVATELITCQT